MCLQIQDFNASPQLRQLYRWPQMAHAVGSSQLACHLCAAEFAAARRQPYVGTQIRRCAASDATRGNRILQRMAATTVAPNRVKLSPVSHRIRVIANVLAALLLLQGSGLPAQDTSSAPAKKSTSGSATSKTKKKTSSSASASQKKVAVQKGTCAAQEVHGVAHHQAA